MTAKTFIRKNIIIFKKFALGILILTLLILTLFSGNIYWAFRQSYGIKAPYLSITTHNASDCIGISFQTPIRCNTTIYIGETTSYLNFSQSDTNQYIHQFNFTGLEPNTIYHYKINSSMCNTYFMNRDYSFKTAPTETNPSFTFTVTGDTRPDVFGYSAQKLIMRKMIETNPDFMLNVGDIVLSPARDDHWERFFDCITINDYASTHPYMVSIGNHETFEYNVDNGLNFEKYMFYPNNDFYYAFNYSNTCFFSLDVKTESLLNNPYTTQATVDWVNQTLFNANASSDINWIIGYWHYPPYSSSETYPEIVEKIVPLLELYKVDLVFCGHHHYYERLNVKGIPYIITGGGGAELEPLVAQHHEGSILIRSIYEFCHVSIDDMQLSMKAIDQSGIQFDGLTLIQNNPWRQ